MSSSLAAGQSLTVGSRGSALALWQARHVAGKLLELGIQTRIEIIQTTGDHMQTAALAQGPGKGLFTKEIEQALLTRRIDIAVHSLKDLPTEETSGLTLAAIPPREDPRDALVGAKLTELKAGMRVGTSSARRGAQLQRICPGLVIEAVRGNVDTRLRKLKEGQYDALVLAAAGLKRLGFETEISEVLPASVMCPAPGQGALGVQTRSSDPSQIVCGALDHHDTRLAVEAERRVLAALGGGCQVPLGAFAEKQGGTWTLTGAVISPDGRRMLRESSSADVDPIELAPELVNRLKQLGACDILAQSEPR
jgi:hydroxymethylbilane synthase